MRGYRWTMATTVPRPAGRRWAPGALAVVLAAFLAGGCAADQAGSADTPGDADGAETAELQAAPPADGTTSRAEPAPLVTAQPDQYSEVGDLVEGFPIELLPVPGDAVILVTSAVPVGDADVQEVSLNLRTNATAEQLLELYRTALTAAGFTEVTAETSDSDLAVDVTFVRSGGDELVSIGVLDVDGARTVTIGGRIHK